MKDISQAIQEFLNAHGGHRQRILTRLWEHWNMVMGEDIAPLAFPLGHRKTILLVGAEDTMAAQELTYMAPEILERVHAFMDDTYFTRVEIHLFMGRVPLDMRKLHIAPPSRAPLPPRPENLGNLCATLDPTSNVGRCYHKYVRMYDEIEDKHKK